MSSRKSQSKSVQRHAMGTRPRSPAEALEPGRAPQRPRGIRHRRESRAVGGFVRVMSGLLTLLLIVMVIGGGLSALVYYQFERAGPLEVTRTIVIPKGEGRIEIAERLEREGIISNRWAFVAGHLLQTWLNPGKKRLELKAGEFELKKNASIRQVIETLSEGKTVLRKITIPEGLTSQQIVERLRAEDDLAGDITTIPAEGSLLPDTYRFSKGMSRQELLERMQIDQQRFIAGIWEKRQADLPIKSIAEAIILASIVERETGNADERERVAAVFVNRLRKGMRLQSDPTIIYGIVGGQGTLGRPITRSDIDTKTAHNTYQIDGLPPTPICNPGRSAIEATLNPASTRDIYFVADGTGGHVFTENLKDHNAAVANWRKFEREMRAKQEAQEAADQTAAAAPPAAGAIPVPSNAEAPPPASPAQTATASNIPLPVRKPKN